MGRRATGSAYQDRTGHRSSEMINRYRRAARTAAELRLGWFAPLDEVLLELQDPEGRGRAKGGRIVGLGSPRSAIAVQFAISGSSSTDDAAPERASETPQNGPSEGVVEPAQASRTDDSSDAIGGRMALARRLVGSLAEALEAVDTGAARVAHGALGELLGVEGPVVDLVHARRRRGTR